tara:strand:+ start:585 stop:1325 length:741 start_codon:yes stop_codon:yes gene_type:complete
MRIEFVGLPGAGKSYLCRELGHLLSNKEGSPMIGDTVSLSADEQNWFCSQISKLFGASLFAMRHPLAAFRITQIIRKSGQKSKRHMVTKSLNLLAELRRIDSPRNGSISEQGVLQAVWSIALDARQEVIDKLLVAARPWLPTTAISVDVDSSELIPRLGGRERGRSRFDRLEPADLADALKRGAVLLEEVLQNWEMIVPNAQRITIQNPRGAEAADVLSPVIRLVFHDDGETGRDSCGENQESSSV